MTPLILSQCFSAFSLTGIIWTIQLVHYPSFLDINPKRFVAFHKRHCKNISCIVAPLMILDLVGALLYVILHGIFAWSLYNLLSIVAIFAATFLISVPLHTCLEKGYDSEKIRRLVNTNWIRTLLWSSRSLLWIYLLSK